MNNTLRDGVKMAGQGTRYLESPKSHFSDAVDKSAARYTAVAMAAVGLGMLISSCYTIKKRV